MSLLRAILLVAFGTLLLAESAEAQDCGAWPSPVLCAAELVAVGDSDNVVLSDWSRIELAPRERIELHLNGRDQRGRRFRRDRLHLGVDVGDCVSTLSVEDRGQGVLRVSARAAQGDCTLVVWAPGNLTFEWEIDFEISAAARSGYSRREAEFVVNALYQAILQRDPDTPSFGSAVAEVQAGNLDNLVTTMFRSAEFREKAAGVDASLILERFYQGVLGRESDSGGVRLYLSDMRRGQYASVLVRLIRSPEFERRLPR